LDKKIKRGDFMQNRFKSKAAWISILSLLIFVIKTYGKIEIPESDTLINLILITAASLGIFNNPVDKEKF
jgi:uncharacterized membrane protein